MKKEAGLLSYYYNEGLTLDCLVYFLTACVEEIPDFQPEKSFREYIVTGEMSRCFDDATSDTLDLRLQQAFELCTEHNKNLFDIVVNIRLGEDGKQY